MSPEMRDKLQALADKEERTLSWFCMKVLREYLRAAEKRAGEQAAKKGSQK